MRRLAVYSVALCLLLLALPVATQEEEGTIAKIVFFRAKPGMNQQLEDGLKKHMAWHQAQNGTWAWLNWQYETGENSGGYGAGTFGHRWSDFDNVDVGEAADLADAGQNIFPYVAEGSQWRYYQFLPKVSKPPAEGTATLAEEVVFHPHYGKDAEFMALIKRIHQAIEKTQWPLNYEWYMLMSGGQGPEYVLVIFHKNYASLQGPEKPFPAMLEEALGRQEAEMVMEHFGKIVKGERSSLLRLRPDLSYIPEKGGM
ncbi:MAG TPA: hypothetical protein VJ085_09535 [Candidatus Acidoferrales bacterium]|nr:hypothetical protein [Candidatus Acidoferrales bacterium]